MTPTFSTNDDLVQEEILQAALCLYRRHGPSKVTMDDVANAMGRSRTSLYYYYKNRDEIYQAVLDAIAKEMAAVIRSAVTAAGNLHDRFYAFCIAKLKASDEWKYVLKEMWGAMNDDERTKHFKMVMALHKKLLHQEGVIVNEILSAAVQRNEIRDISAGERDMMAFVISAGIRGIRTEIYDHGDPHEIKAAMRLLTDIISKWLAR
jgi:AcrR family transcriptional regulator